MLVVLICIVVVAAMGVVAWQMSIFLGELNVRSAYAASQHFLEDPACTEKVTPPSIFEEASKSLSVVIPAYNEQDRLPATLDAMLGLLKHMRNRHGPSFTYELIIVDDGSSDGTVGVAFDFVRREGFDAVRVVRLPANRGKGHAVRAGMMIGRGEQLLMADADGATRAEDLTKLQQELHGLLQEAASRPQSKLTANMAMVVGSRAHLEQQALARRPPLRNFLMKGFHFLVTLVAGGAVRDTQCGFKLFTRRAARLLFSNQRLERWCFDVELIFLAEQLRIPVREVSVQWTEVPGSKIRVTSILHMAWELIAVLLGYRVLQFWTVQTESEIPVAAGH